MRAVILLTALLTTCWNADAAHIAAPKHEKVIPLVFEQSPDGSFIGRTSEGSFVLNQNGAVLFAGRQPVSLGIAGGRSSLPEPMDPLPGVSNYLIGNDPSRWRTGIRQFGKVRYANVRPGVDLIFYGSEGRLEYDIVLRRGASTGTVALQIQGADRIHTDQTGDLLIEAGGRTIRQWRPKVFQHVDGQNVDIASSYLVKKDRVEFALGRFDPDRELTIDPVIQYASYIGKAGQDSAVAVAVDAAGNAYIAGETNSPDLAAGNVAQNARAGDTDAYIAKVGPAGTLQYLTYIGGRLPDTGLGVAVDSAGNVFISGVTFSADFPTRGAAQASFGGGQFDTFAAKLDASGSRFVWSTYVGGAGDDWSAGIAVDGAGNAWVSGWTTSANFPLQSAFQRGPSGGGGDVFVTRFNSLGDMTYSSYVGGEGNDLASGVAVDSRGNVYVAGGTNSRLLPFTAAVQERNAGMQDAFVFRLDPEKNEMVFCTLLGGSGEDLATKVAADAAGNAYITGYTQSTNFPATRGAAQAASGGMTDIFVARIGPGKLDYATLVGGNGDDWSGGIVVDAAGSAYVSGWTNSGNFPLKNAFQTSYASGNRPGQRYDGVVFRVSPQGDSLLYSSFLGGTGEEQIYGIALDPSGNAVVTGTTNSQNFPSAANSFGSAENGNSDGFVARLSADAAVNLVASVPASLSLAVRAGEAQGPAARVALSTTAGAVQFSAGSLTPWVRVSPESGRTPATLTVTVEPGQLASGINTAEVLVRTASNTLTIPVTVNVTLAPSVTAILPASLLRGSLETIVTITGVGFTAGSTVEVGGVRLPAVFLNPNSLRVTLPSILLTTEGPLSVVIVNADARSSAFVLPVNAPGSALAVTGLQNAATNAAGAIAPGEIVTVAGTGFGPETLLQAGPSGDRFSMSLAGLTVLFDGVPAPVLWVQSGRAAVVVPYAVSGRNSSQLVVDWRGQQSPALTVPVQTASPGLFTAAGTGQGPAAAMNQDGTLNSANNPALRGSTLVLYGTGEGRPDLPISDGAVISGASLPHPVLPVTVLIDGVPAVVEFAGGSPGQIAGLMQINVRVPEGVTAGTAVPIVVFAGGFSSPAGVTVSIR